MSQYLDSDACVARTRRMMRLTVVTTFGLIGTVATGFLGMNLIAATRGPERREKLANFVGVFVPMVVLTFYTVGKSRRLSEFLDALADDAVGMRAKWRAFWRIWWLRGTD